MGRGVVLEADARVANAFAQGAGRGVGEALHQRRQVLKSGFAADQRIEPWIDEQRERKFHAPAISPARAALRRNVADLAGFDVEPAGMEGAAERHAHGSAAVPAHLDHGRFLPGEFERGGEPGRMAAGVEDKVALCARCRGQAVGEAERSG